MQEPTLHIIIIDRLEDNIQIIKNTFSAPGEPLLPSNIKWHIISEDVSKKIEELPTKNSFLIFVHISSDSLDLLTRTLHTLRNNTDKSKVSIIAYADGENINACTNLPVDNFIKLPLSPFEVYLRTKKVLELKKVFAQARQTREKLENSSQRNRTKTINLFGKHNDLRILQRETKVQKDKLLEQNIEIKNSIQHARLIQAAVAPTRETLERCFKEYFILNFPLQIVSGDFLWVERIQNATYFAVADCTGHGVPGAMMSMLGISLLNSIILRNTHIQVNELLNELRHQLILTSHTGVDNDDPGFAMDIGICKVDYERKKLYFSGANRKLFFARNNIINIIDGDRMPVGLYPKKEPFSLKQFDFQENDIFYLFSDGYTDQFGGPNNRKFKLSTFKKLLTEVNHLPLQQQKNKLTETFNLWKGSHPQVDDVLVLGIRI